MTDKHDCPCKIKECDCACIIDQQTHKDEHTDECRSRKTATIKYSVRFLVQPNEVQKNEHKFAPPISIIVDTTVLFQIKINVSLIDLNGDAVRSGIVASGDNLKIVRNVITFDNILLGLAENVPSGNYRIRIIVGDISVDSNQFYVDNTLADVSKRTATESTDVVKKRRLQ